VLLLKSLDIPFMLVGSHASSYYGETRLSQDIEIVVDLAPPKIQSLVQRVDPRRYYHSETAIREGCMASLIDTHTGDEVNLPHHARNAW
jgi:hypothetical protein